MSNPSTITVSFPLGLFGNATMNVPAAPEIKIEGVETALRLPMERELLDMPNVIPETEGADRFFYFDETEG